MVTSNTEQINSSVTGASLRKRCCPLGRAVGAGLEVDFAPSWSVGVVDSNQTFEENERRPGD